MVHTHGPFYLNSKFFIQPGQKVLNDLQWARLFCFGRMIWLLAHPPSVVVSSTGDTQHD
jgi:hypothetical protein